MLKNTNSPMPPPKHSASVWAFGAIGISWLLCAHYACQLPAAAPPNIIIILTDDLGYADLSSYGTTYLHTPHIDSLVKGGIQFSNYHTNSPVCSPTRAAILSGRYPDAIGMPGVVRTDTADSWGYLSADAVLLPQILRQRYHYHSAHIGKWNLGLSNPNLPNARGFDHFKGFLGDKMDDYYHHLRQNHNYLRYNEDTITPPDTLHATDLFSQWAADYIATRKGQNQPFFLYLAYNAPHRPTQVPAEWATRYQQRFPETPAPRAMYCAMIEHLDAGIGQVMAALHQAGLADNTIVIFSSDNGGNLHEGANNGDVRGSKPTLYEGGLRVPLAVWFPKRIASGSHSNALVMTMDIAPTLYKLLEQWYPTAHHHSSDTTPPACDGSSFLPILMGDTAFQIPSRDLFWIWRESGDAFGAGNYIAAYQHKGYKILQAQPQQDFELYYLPADPLEQRNLAASDTAIYVQLQQLLAQRIAQSFKIPCKPPR